MRTWAIIPVKSFKESKSRLAGILSPHEREELIRQLLMRLIDVAGKSKRIDEILVVSPDRDVLDLALSRGALTCLEENDTGLNGALCQATRAAREGSAAAILVIPCDLPFFHEEDLNLILSAAADVAEAESRAENSLSGRIMIICPDTSGRGTNALLLTKPLGFTFRFGPGSCQRHLEEANRHEMNYSIVRTPGTAFDLDSEQDWINYQSKLRTHTS